MTSIGDTLRRERLRRGWNLNRVAAETKISLHLLEAIELDRFDRLPGGVFARNFVRQYTRMLQLDEDEVLAAFHQQFEEPPEPEPERAPEPPAVHVPRISPWSALLDRLGPGNSITAFLGLLVVVLACAGVYNLWQKSRRAPPAPHAIATAPRPPAPATKPVEPPKPDFRAAEVSDSGTIQVPDRPLPKGSPVTSASAPGETPSGAVRVSFKASEPVWVSIQSDGAHTYSGTLEGKQTREFGAAKKMTVLVGNAGSLDIALNGKPIGPIGQRGEIQRLILTPSGAHVVPRTPRTSDDSTAPTEPVSDSERP